MQSLYTQRASCSTRAAQGAQQQQQHMQLRAIRVAGAVAATQRRCRASQQQLRASTEQQQHQTAAPAGEPTSSSSAPAAADDLDKSVARFASKTAATFAPRASGAVKNPAVRGSALYWVFEAQAWLGLAAGGLLSFNLIFPTDEPSIPRLLGMWSIWMFTVPSLRAKECMPKEKDALNTLFLLIPLVNVALPFAIKSFPVIFAADVAALVGVYAWKGVWAEVYLPLLSGGGGEGGSEGGEGSSSA